MPDPWNLFRSSLIRASRGFDAAARVCSSLAATSLRRADIRADTDQKWSRCYTRDADIDKGFVRSGNRILVAGCGTGRDVIPLAANGHQVTGVDPSEHAVVLARAACVRRGVTAEIVQGDFEDVPRPPDPRRAHSPELCGEPTAATVSTHGAREAGRAGQTIGLASRAGGHSGAGSVAR